jgi:hypothetical protein
MKTQKSKSPKLPDPILSRLEHECATFRGELSILYSNMRELDNAIALARAAHMPTIKARAAMLQFPRNRIWTLIADNRALFAKPRTRIFSDIKVGLTKQKGATVIADEDKTIALIKKHFPKRLDELAPSARSLSKKALANLTGDDLKKIGIEITADTDAIIIKPQDSDVEKAVAALLAEQTAELKQAA